MNNRLKSVTLKVTRELIREYAAISEDYNPIHVDPEYAAASPMRGIIAHGTLSLNLIWQSLEKTFGNSSAYAMTDIRFNIPVRENDLLEAGGEISENGAIAIWVRNQDYLNVIEGAAQVAEPTAR